MQLPRQVLARSRRAAMSALLSLFGVARASQAAPLLRHALSFFANMLPSLSLPPVECCFGTSPIQAARLRPDEKAFQSPTSATSAVATIGPMPGISSKRLLASHERCHA